MELAELEHELKYALDGQALAAVAAYLDGCCRREEPYGESWVESIYYDTPDLALYGEKAASDLKKTKVRLRWYDGAGIAFAELKRRYGTRRAKLRVPTGIAGHGRSIGRPELDAVPQLLAERGAAVPRGLAPVLRVRYRRRRWVCPGGERVSLDEAIGAPAWAPRYGARARVGIDGGILEVKGPRAALPSVLQPLAALGCRRRSASKYGVLMARLLGEEDGDA